MLEISGCDKQERELDLVFVHGLEGDGCSNWQTDDNPNSFWPVWIADEFPTIGVWSMDYQVSTFAWKGHSMLLDERARESLDKFDLLDMGDRPIGFVCHSIGGLLVKQMLRLGKEFGNDRWQRIAEQTQFIIFLSTPHSGTDIAKWLSYLGTLLRINANIQELGARNYELQQLNTWYREKTGKIKTYVYYETLPTHGVLYVNKASADPGIPGVDPIPLDADHNTICKPASKTAAVYLRVKRLIKETLEEHYNSNIEQAKELPTIDPTAELNMEKETVPASYSGKAKIEFSERLGGE